MQSESKQLEELLSSAYQQGNDGADFQEIMSLLKEELSEMANPVKAGK